MKTPLFYSGTGIVTKSDIERIFDDIGISQSGILYVHTGLSFGQLNRDLSRNELLTEIWEAFLSKMPSTILMPTYTFSFCNNEKFEVETSRSSMGALNEYVRKLPGSHRSTDPLLSNTAVGLDLDLVKNLGNSSMGENSTFYKLSKRKNVKFLFFGVELGDCFTFMHYLEYVKQVPYRYIRNFNGQISESGFTWDDTHDLFVRYQNVVLNDATHEYAQILEKMGFLKKIPLGDSYIGIVEIEPATALYFEILDSNPNYFLTEPFSPSFADNSFPVGKRTSL